MFSSGEITITSSHFHIYLIINAIQIFSKNRIFTGIYLPFFKFFTLAQQENCKV